MVMTDARVLVFAYRDVGHECLAALLARRVNVVAVYTHEDDPNERAWFGSVAALARAHEVPVYAPLRLVPEWSEHVRALRPDLILSFYYRRLIDPLILGMARLGAYNLHGSLLPKYRGRAPVNWAILHGESETGATLHEMIRRADAGAIVDQERVAIGPQESVREVSANVQRAARVVLERQLDNLLAGRAPRREQDETQATYFGRRTPEHGRIDWRQDARAIFNLIRAVTHPYPGAYTELDGRRLYLWWAAPANAASGRPGEVVSVKPLRIAAASGCLEVHEWQWQGDAAPRRGDDHGILPGALLGAPRYDNPFSEVAG